MEIKDPTGKKIVAIDINLKEGVSYGTSYFELPNNVKEFIDLCYDKHGIIGFEYDRDSRNFGVILKENEVEGGE
jgi:hypothetical protein